MACLPVPGGVEGGVLNAAMSCENSPHAQSVVKSNRRTARAARSVHSGYCDYDRDSNRTTKGNSLNSALSEAYTYDT